MHRRNASRENSARTHPTRAAILALLAKDEQMMSALQIRAGLPSDPARAAIAYHLKVLEETRLVSSADGYYKLFE
jgi:DNA-binding transcriptional ArsR family regulator